MDLRSIYKGIQPSENRNIKTENQIKHFGLIKKAFEKFSGIQGSYQKGAVILQDCRVLDALVTGR